VFTTSRQDGFTLTELLVSTTIVLLVMGGALTTVRNAVMINDSASQLADANQNLRAGTNTLIRDLMMAGRIIGSAGIAMPTGAGIAFRRPGPTTLTFDLVTNGGPTLQMESLQTGYHLGPTINGSTTDIVTILTIDEFMPVVTTPPVTSTAPTASEGTIATDATSVTFAATSQWINGDTVNDTPKIAVGDLVFFQGQFGNAIQTVTRIDSTHIYFDSGDAVNDFFNFNQPTPTTGANRPLAAIKQVNPPANVAANVVSSTLCPGPAGTTMTAGSNFCMQVTLFKAAMITYYVDNSNPTTPRLTRQLNHGGCPLCPAKFNAQALAGVVEDLDLTYDLFDGGVNPTAVPSLPWTDTTQTPNVTYTSGMIRKVNLHVGVRSETLSKPLQDFVRNHISTAVNVRSLSAVDRYVTQ
jgi:prepilin-type N-terminal cleavage/methylation domain-containing protein